MAEIPIPAVLDDASEYRILGWCKDAIQEGDAFLKAQEGYDKIRPSIDQWMGKRNDIKSSTLSAVTSNRFGKIADDLASLLTDVKPFWEYKTSNPRAQKTAEIAGKLSSGWYPGRQIDVKMGDAIRYYEVAGSGIIHPFFNEDTQDLDVSAEDPRDVLPIRPANNFTFKGGLGVIIRRQRTVNYVRQMFPNKANRIVADRDGSLLALGNTRAGQFFNELASPFRRRLFGDDAPAREIPRVPSVDLYTLYVDDRRIHEGSTPIVMGETDEDGNPSTNWSYIVHKGEPLFPRKRCIVFTSTTVLYDGPSIYWHGEFPVCKLTLDPKPWSWLGKAPLWDLLPLQKAFEKSLRVLDDYTEKFARPDLIADKNSISKSQMNRLDTRKPGLKLETNPMIGKGIQIQYPQAVPDWLFKAIEMYVGEMETISGVQDMSKVMQLNQLPSASTIEKVMESMTPSVRGRSRAIEAFMREFAMMTMYNFAQFYDINRRLAVLGPDGVTYEDFDYDPGTFIPDYVHNDDFDERGIPTAQALQNGPMPRYERAKEFLRSFTYQVAPGSLLAASQIDEQLKYLQLARMGLIDGETLLEKMGIPNIPGIRQRLMEEAQMNMGVNTSPQGRKAAGETMPRQVMKSS